MGNATSVRIHWADNDEFQFLSFVIYDFKDPYPIFVVDKLIIRLIQQFIQIQHRRRSYIHLTLLLADVYMGKFSLAQFG